MTGERRRRNCERRRPGCDAGSDRRPGTALVGPDDLAMPSRHGRDQFGFEPIDVDGGGPRQRANVRQRGCNPAVQRRRCASAGGAFSEHARLGGRLGASRRADGRVSAAESDFGRNLRWLAARGLACLRRKHHILFRIIEAESDMSTSSLRDHLNMLYEHDAAPLLACISPVNYRRASRLVECGKSPRGPIEPLQFCRSATRNPGSATILPVLAS
jgi:hypothetical protein